VFWNNVNVLFMLVATVNSLTQNPTYLAVPMFIFMGALLEKSGVADNLFDSMYIVMGRVKGGLAIAVVIICTFLAATTGVIAAAISLMTMLGLPAMMKYKYDFKLATGTIMAAGSLGQLIPPSVIMIVFAAQAQLSVGRMFAGGIFTGLMFSMLFILYIIIRTIINPNVGPAIPKEEAGQYSVSHKIGLLVKSIAPTIFLIVMVLGSIIGGVASPTEGAAVGCFGALILCLINKRLNMKVIVNACHSTTLACAMIFFIIVSASMFTYVFMGLRGHQLIGNLLIQMPFDRWVVMAIILAMIFILSMVLDAYGMVMICVPVIMPIIRTLGFDPLWFSIVFVCMMLISFMSPPFAYAAFFVKGASRTHIAIGDLYAASWQYIAVYLVGVVLLCFFPEIITFLPNLMFG
jgi:tripartite ATP-independent transporter DctM subunit